MKYPNRQVCQTSRLYLIRANFDGEQIAFGSGRVSEPSLCVFLSPISDAPNTNCKSGLRTNREKSGKTIPLAASKLPTIRYSVARKAGHVMNSCALRVGWPGFIAETTSTLNEGTTFPSARADSREVTRIGVCSSAGNPKTEVKNPWRTPCIDRVT